MLLTSLILITALQPALSEPSQIPVFPPVLAPVNFIWRRLMILAFTRLTAGPLPPVIVPPEALRAFVPSPVMVRP